MAHVNSYCQVTSSGFKQFRLATALAVGIGLFSSKDVFAEGSRPQVAQCVSAEESRPQIKQCRDCVSGFVSRLLSSKAKAYLERRRGEFEAFCQENDLNPDDSSVKREYATARLLHEMVKHRGILDNHYVIVEERDSRLAKVAKKGTTKIGADASQRYPGKMTRDMFSEKASYVMAISDQDGQGPKTVRIFSFGDCDELEMVYRRLLLYSGLHGRIIMTGSDHVETVVSIGGKEFRVDNSFNKFGKRYDCAGCTEYKTGRIGYTNPEDAKKYLARINRLATGQIDMYVSAAAMRRITQAVDSFIEE